MIGPEDPLVDGQGAAEKRLGLGQAAGGPEEDGETVDLDREVRMIGAERPLIESAE